MGEGNNKEKKRKTVGQVSLEISSKHPDAVNPIDQMKESLTEYDENIRECIERHKKTFTGNFYVVVITKKEPLMKNVIRNYFSARISCPTPDYDQIVYKFHCKEKRLEFIWVVPSRDTCLLFKENSTQIDPSEWGLLEFVLKFADGSLYKQAKKLNGEAKDSNLVVS